MREILIALILAGDPVQSSLDLLEEGRTDEAIVQLAPLTAEDPRARFAYAGVLIASGDTDGARREYEILVRDAAPPLARDAAFNLGRLHYDQANASIQEDPKVAYEDLVRSEAAYRMALDLDPSDIEARRHVEVIRRRMKILKDLLDQMEDAREESNTLAEQQEQMADDTKERREQNESAEDVANQQDELSQRTQQMLDEMRRQNEQQESDAMQEAMERLEEARREQEAASEALDEEDLEAAEAHQRRASELLQDAQDQLEQSESSEEQGEENQDQEGEGEEEAEGDPIAQRLLEREEAQRARRRSVRRQGTVPVESDW